ncbi:hypothetical protein BH24ACT22_BH24ACT22_09690 [soil metagenome]
MLEAFPDHWNKERGPRLEKVIFRNDISPAEALDLVCNSEGEMDIVTEVAPADAEKVESSEYARLVTIDAMRILACVINRDAEPFGDAGARKALNLAVDRERLIQDGFKGYAYPLAGLIPHYAAGYSDEKEPYPHDPDEAKKLLNEAGYPQGRALRLATPADLEGVAELLADDFRSSLGIEVEVISIPVSDMLAAQHGFVEKTLDLPFDLLVHAWFDLTADAPAAFMHSWFYHSGGAFRAGPPIPRFEELMERYVRETDPEKLNQLDTDMDQLAYDEALSVFLCAPQALYAVNRHVEFVGHATTFEVAETEVTEDHWSRRNGD